MRESIVSHIIFGWVSILVSSTTKLSSRSSSVHLNSLRCRSITPVNLLLQHYAVNTGFEKSKGKTRLALELTKAIKDFCTGVRGKMFEDSGELGIISVCVCPSDLSTTRQAHFVHVIGQAFVLV